MVPSKRQSCDQHSKLNLTDQEDDGTLQEHNWQHGIINSSEANR